jgi:MSHA biogenesis protein MshI
VKKHDLFGADCNYVLNSSDYLLGLMPLVKDTTTGMITNINTAIKDLVNYPPEDAVVNFFELPMPRASDNVPLGYIVAMSKFLVSQIEQTVGNIGLNLRFIDIPEMVLRNLAVLHPANQNGILFFHLTSKGGTILMIHKDLIYVTRKVNLGLDKFIIEANKTVINIPEDNDVLDRLTLDIQRSMDYCSSLFRYSPANSILLSPTELDITLIQGYLKNNLGIEVYVLDLDSILKNEYTIAKQQQAKCILAIGAALRGSVGGEIVARN